MFTSILFQEVSGSQGHNNNYDANMVSENSYMF